MSWVFGRSSSDVGDVGSLSRRIVFVMAVTTALTVAVGSTAVAAGDSRKPLLREAIGDVVVNEVDALVFEACGVEVRSETRVRGHFVLYGDLSARTHLNFEIVYADPETGDVLAIERDAETFFDDAPLSETVDEDAGTRTVVFESTLAGLPFRAIVPGEGVLLRDAGRITFLTTVVFDLATGEELSFEEEVTDVRGPHPFIELTPEERIALLCSVVSD